MAITRIDSVEGPFTRRPRAVAAACELLIRAEYLGIIDPSESVGPLTEARVRHLAQLLASHGVGTATALLLENPAVFSEADEDLASLLIRLRDQASESPMPESEWSPMRRTFGDDLLARLLGVSTSSLVRYAEGQRTTPDAVGLRLHTLALITSDLAGGYNDRGVRRWFLRSRTQLDGRSPAEVLTSSEDPDGDEVARVRQLAAWVVGAGSAA